MGFNSGLKGLTLCLDGLRLNSVSWAVSGCGVERQECSETAVSDWHERMSALTAVERLRKTGICVYQDSRYRH
jgi:hypothetical protein